MAKKAYRDFSRRYQRTDFFPGEEAVGDSVFSLGLGNLLADIGAEAFGFLKGASEEAQAKPPYRSMEEIENIYNQRMAEKDEAFEKGYLKEAPGQSILIEQPPSPPKPSLDEVVDMVWEGKSDNEIISILEGEGKTREMCSVLERAKRRVWVAKKKITEKEKRRMEIREIHDIRKSRREEW